MLSKLYTVDCSTILAQWVAARLNVMAVTGFVALSLGSTTSFNQLSYFPTPSPSDMICYEVVWSYVVL